VSFITLYGPCLPELNTMDGWMDKLPYLTSALAAGADSGL